MWLGKIMAMEDMLSRARCQEKIEELVDDEEELNFFKTTPTTVERDDEGTFSTFNEDDYKGNWLLIDRFLSTLMANLSWTKEEA